MTILQEAIEAWSATLGGAANEQRQRCVIVRALLAEIEAILRDGPRGNTTLKLCHPEGRLRKAYLQDREL